MLVIEELKAEIPVYDITVEDNHNFYANDILIHNCEISLVTRPVSAEYPLGIIDVHLGEQTVSVPGHQEVQTDTGRQPMAFVKEGEAIRLPFADDFKFRVVRSKKYTKEAGAIALCTLGAINVGKIDITTATGRERAIKMLELAVRAKDALLDYQDYPLLEAELAVREYRPLGFGYIGFAHWLAKNRLVWGSQETVEKVNELAEFISFYLIKASIQLAKEFGPCDKRTKYHDGWMPFDDSPMQYKKTLPWDELRDKARKYGIRNATLQAFMPSETSSQLANETNGIEPPLSLVTIKDSKGEGNPSQVVPECQKLAMYYQLRWDVSCKDYLTTLAPIQHYADQAISLNTSYDPRKLPRDKNNKILMSTFASDFVLAYKLGHKNLYYLNVNDRDDELDEDDDCSSGACKI